ncbi:MAG: thiamine pyrophosphate-dependent enzyme [Candidatus Pacebacteria bacterium]|nr:thiamine pyrophosphate-dependent enzyme [Candidatus Paceibacterota bacterium]MDD2757173.1 thiamine pyrophosphate-dependent enzyme [Candidatus Paceibacterota bacterium]MDD3283655.1 thiamine pyrophosphate-dependent enzyme [Candidatus Paceibacterota bacterium]MDD3969721.1 thiamine pyrophosphate-dependent enzyme [Candidatus Paceibacterota bacterium]MDD4737683.1 thiamine pyrophosphate-dependent enzyme [Candidatus Paceibacterota bacterium]
MKIENTWCPGCGNFGVLESMKRVIKELGQKNVVLVSDIGCNSKIVDYLDVSSLNSLHGRPIPTASGVKMANPKLKVIVFTGDGGSLNEGISHLIHAAKKNTDITVIMHNNRLFALTTGQYTAASPKGFKSKSTPYGSIEEPLNPLGLMKASKASFIGRTYSSKIDYTKDMIIEAVNHKGFSFVEILQPCPSFFDTFKFYNERVYEAPRNEKLINEWDYINESKIPLGVFYKEERPTYEDEI